MSPLFLTRPRRAATSQRLPSRRAHHAQFARKSRRRGVAFVYTALGLAVALMVAAIVIDVGLLYQRKAAMQGAVDSAALAGAYSLANFGSPYDAYIAAGKMAERPENGGYTRVSSLPGSFTSNYVANVGKSKFTVTYPGVDENGVQHNNWFKVSISRPEDSLFGGMWPLNKKEHGVSASATALYDTLAPLDIKGSGEYGVAPGPVNLSVFGPDGRYSYGDCYSTKLLNDGTPNTRYNPNGYDFRVQVPMGQTNTSVEIFDPDCYNSNGSINASATGIDELRTRTGNGTAANATTTRYTLYWDKGTADPSDDKKIGDSREWGAKIDGAPDTDMKWVDAFRFNRQDYPTGNFRLNVTSISGSSENGFDLRAGPVREETTTYTTERYQSGQTHFKGTLSGPYRGYAPNSNSGIYYNLPAGPYDFYDPIYSTRQVVTKVPAPDWNSNNGTSIQAIGHLPINFNISGTVKMALGKVPPQAGGGELIITKFDTDVVAKDTIKYTCDKITGPYDGGWKGTLSTDGTFATDTIRIPDEYRKLAEAGTWYAEYEAGNQDTSVWDMSYTGVGDGRPGQIKLVR